MSLQYVIDGYNLIKHPLLAAHAKNSPSDRDSLLNFIKHNRLTGSLKNSVTVVFDGYPDQHEPESDSGIRVIFSRKISADEKIKMLVEESGNRKNIVVVSNDRQVRDAARMLGAAVAAIEDFVSKQRDVSAAIEKAAAEPKLTYTQMQKINEELRKRWLKTS